VLHSGDFKPHTCNYIKHGKFGNILSLPSLSQIQLFTVFQLEALAAARAELSGGVVLLAATSQLLVSWSGWRCSDGFGA
jgi:hypothetical protein